MSDQENRSELLELTSEIVAAHVSNNTLAVNHLPQLIQDVYATLATVGMAPASSEKLQPAVSVTVTLDAEIATINDKLNDLKDWFVDNFPTFSMIRERIVLSADAIPVADRESNLRC